MTWSTQTPRHGAGASPELLNTLLESVTRWYMTNNLQQHLPSCLVSNASTPSVEPEHLLQSFSLTHDQRKLEVHSLILPSGQRAIIEHYLATVSPEFPLIPAEIESMLLKHENPLRWASANKSSTGAFAISIVFAISASLATRDLDPYLACISQRCVEEVHKISERPLSPGDAVEVTRWTCTALCALCLCELVGLTSGQLWDLLGRAAATVEDLREGYQLQGMKLDSDFHRLEHSLLKLDWYVSSCLLYSVLTLDLKLDCASFSTPCPLL